MDANDPGLKKALIDCREVLPRLWYALYQGSIQAGFTEAQALSL